MLRAMSATAEESAPGKVPAKSGCNLESKAKAKSEAVRKRATGKAQV